MARVANLSVGLSANTAEYRKGLTNAQKRTQTFTQRVRNSFKGFGQNFDALRTSIVGVVAVLGTKKLLDNADALVKNSTAAGFNFEVYQRLQHGFENAGVSQEAFAKSTVRVNKLLIDAGRGSKTAVDALGELGLRFEDLNQLSPEKRYLAIVSSLNNIEDPARKAAIAQEVLGRQFSTVSINIDDVVKEGEKLIPINEEVARSAEGSNDAFNTLTTNLGNLTTNILGPLAESLTPVVDAFSNFAKQHPELTKLGLALTAVAVALKLLGGPVTLITGAITLAIVAWQNWDTIVATVKQAWENFGERFPVLTEGIKKALNILLTPIRTLMNAFRSLSKIFEEFSFSAIIQNIRVGALGILRDLVAQIGDVIEKMPVIGKRAASAFRDEFLTPLNEAYQEAVGGSIVPDMVTEIEEWMGKLPNVGKSSGEQFRDNFLKGLAETTGKAGQFVSDIQKGVAAGTTGTGEVLAQSFDEILSKTGQYSKKAFNLNKKFQTASALIDAYRAFNVALSSAPPPFNYAVAAGTLAIGLAQVQAIQSQQFQGLATGGVVRSGGVFTVGENGPENVFLPGGAEVAANGSALGPGGGIENLNYTVVNQVGPNVSPRQVGDSAGRDFMDLINTSSLDAGSGTVSRIREAI